MGRPSNTEERRAEIVLGLRRAMARLGYARATVAEIAREAGLAPGLVHYHFADKAEILRTLVDGLVATARGRIEARVAAASTARARLDAFIDALLARGPDDDTDAAACWALVGAEAVTQPVVRALYAEFVAEIATRLGALLVAACHAEGRSGDGCRALAGALVATIEGYFALGSAVPEVVPLGSAAAMTRRMARGLVRAQPKKEPR
jgi:TetR/AcrR family transcriptional regulator, transcriptional repressor of bet genes